jgi:tetratricopeptide (TPR) repeat protein
LLVVVVAAGVGLLVILGAVFRWDMLADEWLRAAEPQPSLLELANAGRYDEVLSRSTAVLAERPLDSETLLLRGIAHFYRAVGAAAEEEREPHLDQAIISVRRARLDTNLRARPEAGYVLGKAYFHKGPFYYDQAVAYLAQSLADGYEAADTHEYLGLAHMRSGELETGLQHFTLALERRPTARLYLAVGQIFQRLGRNDEAVAHFQSALSNAADLDLEVRTRFLLGGLLLERARFSEARDQYHEILKLIPGSADALVYLGDAHAGLGDGAQARAAWRRARTTDPLHHGANLRLRA